MTAVAVLGTGIMGAGMTRSMLREGLAVTVWNRSPKRAAPLAEDGATVAGSAAEAVAGADVVVTMLFDTDAAASVMAEAAGHMREGAVWLQAGTVGIEGIERLHRLAQQEGIAFLDAPMLGTRAPAENGALVVLASGRSSLRGVVDPVLDAIGSRTQWVGEAVGDASKLKLAVNAWIGVMVNGVAQSIALAQGLGLDPAQFLAAVAGQAVDSPYVQTKGKAMIADEHPVSFGLDGVIKDTDLILDALHSAGVDATLATAVRARLAAASAAGYGSADMSAAVHGYAM